MTSSLVRTLTGLVSAACLIASAPRAGAASEPRKVIIDTDGDADYDDTVAVMLAAMSPEIELLGVVATGSEPEQRARTIGKALAIVGRDDVGVYLGELPMSPQPDFPYMSQFPARHYDLRPLRGVWAQDVSYQPSIQKGVDFYLEQIARFPGQVSVVVTGPPSTLGRAMQLADQRGQGAEFRRGIGQILFSGGDFDTVEYNIYCDLGAARLVLHSGVPIYQFGGEGEGKAYLVHEARQRLWDARTPATWALQDLYRLWRAGWDPTSPFVPILYDVHPVAFLIVGDTISRFEPAAVDLDDVGHLVHVAGPPNAFVRVANDGAALVGFAVDRLTGWTIPAINHLRALRLLGGAELAPEIDPIIAKLQSGSMDRAHAAGSLDTLQPKVAGLAQPAQQHLDLARRFISGETRAEVWQDPYTARRIALIMPFYKVYFTALEHQRRVALVGIGAVAALALYVRRRRRWRAERRMGEGHRVGSQASVRTHT
jgi:purine nucleosidase